MTMTRAVIAVAFGIAFVVPSATHACSRRGFSTGRSANTAHFIGTPLADTVFAGTGSVRYLAASGHSGSGGARTVFGQVVSVERIGGLASRALRKPVQQVVLVPWHYAPDCTPIPWTRSVTWVEPGTRGLFNAVLRDSVHWAGGVPTFDVFAPELQPYPQQVHRQRGVRSQSTDSLVPIDELFELIEIFPDGRLLPDSGEAATAQLFAWARANPTLTQRYPIADALLHARGIVGRQRLRAIRSPLMGTYQMTVSLSGGPARTFYARTRGIPTSEWNYGGPLRPRVDDPTIVPRPDGYHLLASVAESLAALPQTCERGRDKREGYIVVVNPPPDSTPDPRRWTGKLEMSLVKRAFVADSAVDHFASDEFEAFRRRSREKLPIETPAHFAQSADGSIRVEQKITLEDGRSLSMSGLRISPDTVSCPS